MAPTPLLSFEKQNLTIQLSPRLELYFIKLTKSQVLLHTRIGEPVMCTNSEHLPQLK